MQTAFAIILIISLIGYAGFIIGAAAKISKLKKGIGEGTAENEEEGVLSIIVAVRNEQAHLPALFKCLEENEKEYSSLKTLICNDHSTDKSWILIENWCKEKPDYRIALSLETHKTGKKAAIEKAVTHCKTAYALLTDADCTFEGDRAKIFAGIIGQQKPRLIAGVVQFNQANKNFLSAYQVLENQALVLLGATALLQNKALTCNGANLCFEVTAFIETGGYKANGRLLSGDDDFLLHEIHHRYPGEIVFNAAQGSWVETEVQTGFKAFLFQRVRWAGKTLKLPNKRPFVMQVLIALFCIAQVVCLLSPLWLHTLIWCVFPMVKLFADLVFHHAMNRFYGNCPGLLVRVAASVFQVWVIPLIAALVFVVNADWKGRKVSV